MKALKFQPTKHVVGFFHLPSYYLIMGYETTYLKRAQPVSRTLGTCIESSIVLLFTNATFPKPTTHYLEQSFGTVYVCAVPLSWEVFCLLKTHSPWATKPSKIPYLTALCTLGPKQGLLHSCIQAFYCKQQKISSCQALSYHIKPSYPIPSRPGFPWLLKISLNMKKDIKLLTSTKSALHRLNHKCIHPSQP